MKNIRGEYTFCSGDKYIGEWKDNKYHGKGKKIPLYGKGLYEEVKRYALKAGLIAENEKFDVIHAHDWMTYEAGINAKKQSGKKFNIHEIPYIWPKNIFRKKKIKLNIGFNPKLFTNTTLLPFLQIQRLSNELTTRDYNI